MLIAILAGGPHVSPGQMTVVGAAALRGDRFVTRSGKWVSVLGIQAPHIEDDGTVVSRLGRVSRRRLQALVEGKTLRLGFDPADPLRDGKELAAHVYLPSGRLLSEVMLEEGFAWPDLISGTSAYERKLVGAFMRARTLQLGVHAGRKPHPRPNGTGLHRGVSMGIYSRDPEFDYAPLLDRAKNLHASHLLLITPWFMKDWESAEIEAVAGRTAPWKTTARVARQARDRGLRVTLMPIVLLRTGTKDHWRGDIAPRSRLKWWRNYAELMGRYADIAESAGAAMLSVGSEFSSMEKDTDRWRTLIRNLRLRFGGDLTYSANWDHFGKVTFWDALDRAGMTGYHSLTQRDDPDLKELVAAWTGIKERVLNFQKVIKRPVFFTEVGYASVDGINKDPWNYYISKKVDKEEQAACFRAFIQAWRKAPAGYGGAYFYNLWRNSDKDDHRNYSFLEKPAEQVIATYYRSLEEASEK